ncbi:MAG: BON domain-containing protein [Hydrogenophaga sp.]|nr:BON domain-containing protein [Hydrogenophaga sp.]
MFQSRYLPLALSALALAVLTTACGKTEPEASTLPPPATTTVGTDIDDSVVTARVKTAFTKDDGIKGTDIAVETRKGEVILSGFVDNRSQIDRAVILAKTIEGVHNVRNDLVVKQ